MRWREVIFRRTAVLVAWTIMWTLAVPWIAWGLDTTPAEILANADRFDGEVVTIAGKVTNLRETVSRRGNQYYTYDLHDGRPAIRIFSFGRAPCGEGATASVEGRFTKVKKVSGRTFYNEIEALSTRCR